MVTYCISSDCVALLLPEGTDFPVRTLVTACLRKEGLRPWSDMEAELYAAPCGRLLIARPRGPLRSRLAQNAPRLCRRTQ